MFSCEYSEIFKNTYLEEHLRTEKLFCQEKDIRKSMEEVEFIEDTFTEFQKQIDNHIEDRLREFQEQIDNHLEKRSMVNRV